MNITINYLRTMLSFEWDRIIDRDGYEFVFQKGATYVDDNGNFLRNTQGWTADDGENVYPEYVLWDTPILSITGGHGYGRDSGVTVQINL